MARDRSEHAHRWTHVPRLSLSLLLLIVSIVAAPLKPSVWAESPETLTIAAANSLRDVLRSLFPKFEAHFPHISIRVVYGPSQTLREQIQQGAPVDVFMPSLLEEIEWLEQRGLIIQDTKQIYAGTELVLITSTRSVAPVETVEELKSTTVSRLAVGDPKTSSLGKVTAQFLRSMTAKRSWRPRYVYGEHSKVVLDLVANGEAELGIAYRTDAVAHPNLRIIDTVPSSTHSPILYAAATVWTARNISGAKAFTEFLSRGAVQAELERYGFARPTRSRHETHGKGAK